MRYALLTLYAFLITFQSAGKAEGVTTYWPLERDCAVAATAAMIDYSGVIFTYEPDVGVRASRADMASSYFVAFEGANFTGAAGISTDGQWIAIPAGYLSVVSSVDETYIINEVRVQSTAPGTISIRARLPWSASYRGADAKVVRSIRWLDDTRFVYAEDDWETDTETLVTVDPFENTRATIEDPHIVAMSAGVSADMTRAFGVYDHHNGLFDITRGDLLVDVDKPRDRLVGWAPDSSMLAVQTSTVEDGENVYELALIGREGAEIVPVADLYASQWVWSPDSHRFAFTAYDPERSANITYIGDTQTQTLIDTCIAARQGDSLTGPGLAWSPDGRTLALMADAPRPLQLLDVETLTLSWVENHTETITSYLLGWYPLPEN